MTSFTPSLMMPLRGMFVDRIREYGVEPPQLSWMRIDTPDKISALMSRACYRDIEIQQRQMGYYLKESRQWLDVLWNSGYRGLLSQLSAEDLKKFMNEHLKEIDSMADENGIWLEVGVLFATARKA